MSNRAFTLMEMVLATGLAIVILVSLAPLFPALGRSAASARHRMAALHLAQQQMEQSLAQGYQGVTARSGTVEQVSQLRSSFEKLRFDYEVTVADHPPDLRSILVTVQWSEGSRRVSEQLQCLLVQP